MLSLFSANMAGLSHSVNMGSQGWPVGDLSMPCPRLPCPHLVSVRTPVAPYMLELQPGAMRGVWMCYSSQPSRFASPPSRAQQHYPR